MINKLILGAKSYKTSNPVAQLTRRLIRKEAQLGGQLFGDASDGSRSEFFCLDKQTWVWHHETLVDGRKQTTTTHYKIQPSSATKSVDGQAYVALSAEEAARLHQAIKAYDERVVKQMYP